MRHFSPRGVKLRRGKRIFRFKNAYFILRSRPKRAGWGDFALFASSMNGVLRAPGWHEDLCVWHVARGIFAFLGLKTEGAIVPRAKGGGVWHEVLFSGNAPWRVRIERRARRENKPVHESPSRVSRSQDRQELQECQTERFLTILKFLRFLTGLARQGFQDLKIFKNFKNVKPRGS